MGRTGFFMPRKQRAVRYAGRCPAPARGMPPGPPARFPFRSMFQNGPRRQGFASPRTIRAPLTAPGRSEDLPMIRESGQTQTLLTPRLCAPSRWSGPSCTKILE